MMNSQQLKKGFFHGALLIALGLSVTHCKFLQGEGNAAGITNGKVEPAPTPNLLPPVLLSSISGMALRTTGQFAVSYSSGSPISVVTCSSDTGSIAVDCTVSGNDLLIDTTSSAGVSSGTLTLQVKNTIGNSVVTTIPISAYSSCKQILTAGVSQGSGRYIIDVDGSGPNASIEAACDMNTSGGGWTMLINGADTTRADLQNFFFNGSASDLPDSDIYRDSAKGIFFNSNQYLYTRNLPTNSEFKMVVYASPIDPTYGINCFVVVGISSPGGYDGTPGTFTYFTQKNELDGDVKSMWNSTFSTTTYPSDPIINTSYSFPLQEWSRLMGGSPKNTGDTCTGAFFVQKLMVR